MFIAYYIRNKWQLVSATSIDLSDNNGVTKHGISELDADTVKYDLETGISTQKTCVEML